MKVSRRRLTAPLRSQLAEHKGREVSAELAAVRKQLALTTAALERERNTRRLPALQPAARRPRLKGDFVRVCVGDLHGAKQCPRTVAAFLADLKAIQPHELILGRHQGQPHRRPRCPARRLARLGGASYRRRARRAGR